MKKSIALLIVFSFGVFFTTPISAQRLNQLKENQNFTKTPVKYKSIDAFSDGNGVWLEWETSFESGNIGFNIYRSNGIDKELISPSLIPGVYLKKGDVQTIGEKYTFFDADGDSNSLYSIETFNIDGQKRLSNSVYPNFVSDLTEVAGKSSDSLRKASRTENSIILKNEPTLSKEMKGTLIKTLNREYAAKQHFVAAQPGVKIGVKKEGFYRVSRAELQSAGFDVLSTSTNWQLYKDGAQQAINVGTNGEYIEFYGTELDTPETDTQIYFLINGAQNGKRIESSASRAFGGRGFSPSSFSQSTFFKERKNYFSNIRNGDEVENFFGRLLTNTPVTINLNLPAVDFSVATASINLTVQGVTQLSHQTKVVLNEVEIGTITGSGLTSMSKQFDIATSALREGTNALKLTTLAGASDASFFDTVKVSYPMLYKAQQNRLSFYQPSYKEISVDGFTSSNVRIFDISNPDQPKFVNAAIESNGSGGFHASINPNRARLLFGIEDTALLSAASIKANAPSTLSDTANSANMLIISYKDWMSQANDWADYRRGQGLSVEVVDIEDVYDEFSFGAFSSDAIKEYLKFAYNNRQTKPGYVLLIGDGTYNPRGYTNAATPPVEYNFVPTKIVETVYLETGSDEALADFNNNGLATIPIGRLPVHDAQTVTDILNKVKIYEENIATQNLSRGVLFASDLPNGYDFAGVNSRLRSQLPAATPGVMVNKGDTNGRARLLEEMNAGKFLINYSGHGNTSAWSASPTFFGNADVAGLSNGNNLSIFTMLTCLNGYFIQTPDSLAELLLSKKTGGAVAAWASSGETTPDIQEIMATRFFNKIGGDNTMRLGDLIKDAKTTIPGGRDVRLSWVLLGDPALKVR